MHDAKNVALIDLNPDQGNLELWWRIRGSPLCPMLIQDITSIVRDVERLVTTAALMWRSSTRRLHQWT